MTKYLITSLLFISFTASSQALRDINYDYLYNPSAAVSVELQPVRQGDRFSILYELRVSDTTDFDNRYSITWERRQLLSDREGQAVALQNHETHRTPSGLIGRADLPAGSAGTLLVARVTNLVANHAWLFYTPLDEKYPVNNFLVRRGTPVVGSFVSPTEPVSLGVDSGRWTVSYYNDNFPAAAPAFSEALAGVSAEMVVDSVFQISGAESRRYSQPGLYLVQRDTATALGLAFRVEEDFPQYSKLTNLPDPLIYLTTRQEHERLVNARGNKRVFDRVILNITQNTERARVLMRNYFRRVELANRFFTSYKEGWKTDRGMVFIIFGMPEEVYKFDDREVWEYNNNRIKERFTFVLAGSVFGPDNFVLIRQRKREEAWYEMVDLWRKARF